MKAVPRWILAVILTACSDGNEPAPIPTSFAYSANPGGSSGVGGTIRFVEQDGGIVAYWEVEGYRPGPETVARLSDTDWQVLAYPVDVGGFYVHHLDLVAKKCRVSWTRAPNDFVPGYCVIR